jgi:hypothetical protein
MANIRKTNKPAQSIQGKIIEIVQKNKSQLFFILTVGIVMVIYYSITELSGSVKICCQVIYKYLPGLLLHC